VADVAPAARGPVLAWGLWDWGSSAFNAVIGTFVFAVYLTGTVGDDLPGAVSANSWLGYGLGAAGLAVAVLAPMTGQRADAAGRRKLSVGIWTGAVVASTAAMYLVRDDSRYFALGVVLLGLGSIFFELASVSYNALLVTVSTPATIGRVSGFGWAMGYLGGIVLLLVVYLGFLSGRGGLLGLSTADGFNVRVVTLVAAGWFAVFALPLLVIPEPAGAVDPQPRPSVAGSYRKLVADLRALHRTAPHTVYFLAASALFRDGLAAVFAFGAVLAVTVYGLDAGGVLLFGIAANVTAAAGALAAGRIDDRVGPKAVIVGALLGMLLAGGILLVVSGPLLFWIFGLFLTLFVGPAQSSSRTFLARLAPPGHEGLLFGLYAATGRAVSFLAPTLVGLCTQLFASDRAGIVGILVVLASGLVALWPVAPPAIGGLAGTGIPRDDQQTGR
jgi:UMF1 family MFS transporter